MYRNVCILYRNVHILYISFRSMSASGIVLYCIGWGFQSPNPQEIHHFKWAICVRFVQFWLAQLFSGTYFWCKTRPASTYSLRIKVTSLRLWRRRHPFGNCCCCFNVWHPQDCTLYMNCCGNLGIICFRKCLKIQVLCYVVLYWLVNLVKYVLVVMA